MDITAVSFLIVDIETVPNPTLPEELKPEAPLKNATKPETIEKIKKEWAENTEGQIKKMSCDYRMNTIAALECYQVTASFNSFIESSNGEKQMIERFWAAVKNTELIVGFGISGFDLPTILQRSSVLGIKPSRDLTNLRPYSRSPVYDMQRVLSLTGKPEKGFNLNFWLKYYGLPTKSADASQVYRWHQEGKFKEISEYCKQDVLSTKALFFKILPYYPVPEKKQYFNDNY